MRHLTSGEWYILMCALMDKKRTINQAVARSEKGKPTHIQVEMLDDLKTLKNLISERKLTIAE